MQLCLNYLKNTILKTFYSFTMHCYLFSIIILLLFYCSAESMKIDNPFHDAHIEFNLCENLIIPILENFLLQTFNNAL